MMKGLDYLPLRDARGRTRDAMLHVGAKMWPSVSAMASTRHGEGWTCINVPLGPWGHLSFIIKKHPRKVK